MKLKKVIIIAIIFVLAISYWLYIFDMYLYEFGEGVFKLLSSILGITFLVLIFLIYEYFETKFLLKFFKKVYQKIKKWFGK